MKRTILPSRKRKALRRILKAAVLLFLVNRVFMLGLLFPFQAIRHNEERMGTGRTAVVLRTWAPENRWTRLVYLTENENITMLSGTFLSLLGWMDGYGAVVDCTGDAAVHGGWWSISREGKSLFYVFGRVDDPDITRLEVLAQYDDWETGEPNPCTVFSWNSERADWTKKDGKYYFLFRKYPLDWNDYPSPIYPVAVGYDKDGNELVRREINDYGTSTSYG